MESKSSNSQSSEINTSSKFIPWPIKFDHSYDHKRMSDNLIELLQDYQEILLTDSKSPRLPSNHIDWTQIPIYSLLAWAVKNATKVDHEHGSQLEI